MLSTRARVSATTTQRSPASTLSVDANAQGPAPGSGSGTATLIAPASSEATRDPRRSERHVPRRGRHLPSSPGRNSNTVVAGAARGYRRFQIVMLPSRPPWRVTISKSPSRSRSASVMLWRSDNPLVGRPLKGLSLLHSITLADLDRDGLFEIVTLHGGRDGSITIWKRR